MSYSVFNSKPYDPREIALCRACFSDVGLTKMSAFVFSTYCQLTNTALKPDENEMFPKYICYTCLALLRKLYKFRNACQQSYLQMHRMALWNKLNTKSLHKLHQPKPFLSRPDPDFMTWNIQSQTKSIQFSHHSSAHPKAIKRCTNCDPTELGTMQCYAVNKVNKARKSNQNDNALSATIKSIQPVGKANDSSQAEVFVAGCAKGKRTTRWECKRPNHSNNNVITYAAASLLNTKEVEDAPNPAAHNSEKRTTGINLMNTTATVQNKRGKNYAATGLQDAQNPPAVNVNNSVIGNQAEIVTAVLDNNNTNDLLKHIAPVLVLNNGVIQMTYNAALAVLDRAIWNPINTQNHMLNQNKPTATIGPNHVLVPNLTSTATFTDNTFAQNSNTGSKHAENVSDNTNEVAFHNYEEHFNVSELTEVKSELDDIIKVEHLIHPVDDDGLDGQEISQENDPNHTQHTEDTKTIPNSHNIEVNEHIDDKVVQIDDSSSSSSSSSDSSSSSSSSISSRKTNSGVDAIDLTLDDDDFSVDEKKLYTIPDPFKVLKNKSSQQVQENVVNSENAEVAVTDGISNKRNLIENTNIDVRNEPSATGNRFRSPGIEKITIDGQVISLIPNTLLSENDEKLKNPEDTAKHLSTTKLVEETDKNVKNATKITEDETKNVESQVKNSVNKVNNIEHIVIKSEDSTNVETVTKIVGNKPKIIKEAANNAKPITEIEVKVKIIEEAAKPIHTATNIVEGAAKNIETTTEVVKETPTNIETKTVKNTPKIADDKTKTIAKTETIKPTILSSYYNDDSSSSGSDDLPDCLIGFSKEVYRNDNKRNFTGPEFTGVQIKKPKIMFVEAEDMAFKKWRVEESLSKSKRNLSVRSKSKKRHTSLERRNNKNTHSMRDSLWRRRRDKLREKVVKSRHE